MSSIFPIPIISDLVSYNIDAVVFKSVVSDMPEVHPPSNDWRNTNWRQWILNLASPGSYGLTLCQYLGLARPDLARTNADNYAIFAMCIKYLLLDCLGKACHLILAQKQSRISGEGDRLSESRRGDTGVRFVSPRIAKMTALSPTRSCNTT